MTAFTDVSPTLMTVPSEKAIPMDPSDPLEEYVPSKDISVFSLKV